MFWYVTTFVSILALIAFGLISLQMTSERLTISLEIEKFRPVFAWLKEVALHLREKGREYREHSRET